MPYKVEKEDLPLLQYTPVKDRDDITMLGVTTNGPVIVYTALDEIRFVSWDEIVAWAATAPLKEPEAPKHEKKVREVQKPSKP